MRIKPYFLVVIATLHWTTSSLGAYAQSEVTGSAFDPSGAEEEKLSESSELRKARPGELYESPYTSLITMSGGNLGAIDKAMINEKDETAISHLKQVLKKLGELHGKSSDYEFEIIRTFTASPLSGIDFRQVIDGLDVPESSITYHTESGEIAYLTVQLMDPESPELARTTWLSTEELQKIALSHILNSFGQEEGLDNEFDYKFSIENYGDVPNLAPVYTYFRAGIQVRVHAISGDVISSGSTASGESQCVKKPGASSSGHWHCDTGAFDKFKINGVCQNNHPACMNQVYIDSKSAIDLSRNWASSRGFNGPTNYDLMFEATEPGGLGFYAWFRHTLAGKPIIGSNSYFSQAGTSAQHKDAMGHEYGHALHHHFEPTGYNYKNQFYFAKAYNEMVGDVVRAFASNNYTIDIMGAPNRYLNGGRTFGQWKGNDFYFDSMILSELFVDIRTAFTDKSAAEKMFLTMVRDQSLNSDPSSSDYDVFDLRAEFKRYIYAALTPTQRQQVCSQWTSKGFPGSPCSPPDRPDFISVTSLGYCSYVYHPAHGWLWMERFRGDWENVELEDYYLLCDSEGLFGPYSCSVSFAKNDTSTLPGALNVLGKWHYSMKACNESGCSSLSNATHATGSCGSGQ